MSRLQLLTASVLDVQLQLKNVLRKNLQHTNHRHPEGFQSITKGFHQPCLTSSCTGPFTSVRSSRAAWQRPILGRSLQAGQVFAMPSNKKGQDAKFLLESSFSRDSGICPKACYRNAAPAVLYEQVGLMQQLNCSAPDNPPPGFSKAAQGCTAPTKSMSRQHMAAA